ncbi:RAB35, member RAS oncogene family [Homo sapiens]|uniref:RAB35, member RAS oncogene family n=1 Tax=Homo sapiens TaxID=9606 RepID=F5H7F8_HUMAN|nr:RAB35, member RAS oncogene family [Homo sapiens]KAI4068511.1 RAB35, member RAS oncogene family [Homo sapiens]
MARDYDHLFKLLIIGDSGDLGAACLTQGRRKRSGIEWKRCSWCVAAQGGGKSIEKCGQEQFTVAFCRQHFLRQLHHHDRSGFQDPDRGDQRGEGEAADLGHSGAGALPHHHLHVLSGDPRGHCGLRRHQCRVLCQRQAVASRNQPEL